MEKQKSKAALVAVRLYCWALTLGVLTSPHRAHGHVPGSPQVIKKRSGGVLTKNLLSRKTPFKMGVFCTLEGLILEQQLSVRTTQYIIGVLSRSTTILVHDDKKSLHDDT